MHKCSASLNLLEAGLLHATQVLKLDGDSRKRGRQEAPKECNIAAPGGQRGLANRNPEVAELRRLHNAVATAFGWVFSFCGFYLESIGQSGGSNLKRDMPNCTNSAYRNSVKAHLRNFGESHAFQVEKDQCVCVCVLL